MFGISVWHLAFGILAFCILPFGHFGCLVFWNFGISAFLAFWHFWHFGIFAFLAFYICVFRLSSLRGWGLMLGRGKLVLGRVKPWGLGRGRSLLLLLLAAAAAQREKPGGQPTRDRGGPTAES